VSSRDTARTSLTTSAAFSPASPAFDPNFNPELALPADRVANKTMSRATTAASTKKLVATTPVRAFVIESPPVA
jgi:hypothetical protein